MSACSTWKAMYLRGGRRERGGVRGRLVMVTIDLGLGFDGLR